MSNSTELPIDDKSLNKVLKIDGAQLHSHIGKMVRDNVEQYLNSLLDAEADELCKAPRYQRSADRVDTRAGHYKRKLHTTAGEVNLKVPKLRTLPFETQIIERYRRREASVEEALVEMYLAGVSVRRVEDITEALWGTRVKPSTVSDLNQKIFKRIEKWRNEPIVGEYPYVFVDGIWLKRSWGGAVKNVSILIAVGVNQHGYREILGVCEGSKEDKQSWLDFLRHLKTRGLKCPQLITSDKCLGLIDAIGEVYPQADWQRCVVHWYRNVFKDVPNNHKKVAAAMLKAIHAQEDLQAARDKARQVVEKLKAMRLSKAAKTVEDGFEETLAYANYPSEHWRMIRTNNMLERVMKEIRRRTRVVGSFPDGHSALMLAAARLRHIAGTHWGKRRYLNMERLREHQALKAELEVPMAG